MRSHSTLEIFWDFFWILSFASTLRWIYRKSFQLPNTAWSCLHSMQRIQDTGLFSQAIRGLHGPSRWDETFAVQCPQQLTHLAKNLWWVIPVKLAKLMAVRGLFYVAQYQHPQSFLSIISHTQKWLSIKSSQIHAATNVPYKMFLISHAPKFHYCPQFTKIKQRCGRDPPI